MLSVVVGNIVGNVCLTGIFALQRLYMTDRFLIMSYWGINV